MKLNLCRGAVLVLSILAWCSAAGASDLVFEGPWHTTNRKLDGIMTCVVTELSPGSWQGRFYGVWQGVDFDYKVPFTGPASDLHGTAMIDGAEYTWRGVIGTDVSGAEHWFKGVFGGSRYAGHFELKEKNTTRR